MTILIVEDDRVSALVLRKTLEGMNYKVIVASNGKKAWDCLEREYVPVVITDWMMPDLDGLELCRRIRGLKRRPYTYLILLTARDQRADRLEGLGAGADDFLTKPLDPDELAARLRTAERLLDMQAQLRKLHQDLKQQNRRLAETMGYLQVASHRFAELFNGMPTPCFTYDAKGCIQEWNRAFETLFGLSAEQTLGRAIWQILGRSEAKEEILEYVRRVFAGEGFSGLERTYSRPDGTTIEVEWTTFPVRAPDGSVVGGISAAMDITKRNCYERGLEAANAKLQELVATDGLTGLVNHRTLHERLEVEFESARRYQEPLSVILLDLDRFKAYNDSLGHLAGDEAMRHVAAILQQTARAVDIVARYGGEEFAIVLPQTGLAEAVLAAERLRQGIERAEWTSRPVTASFGVTSLKPDAEDYRGLLREADKALYISKSKGRNRVTHFDDLRPLAEAA